MLWRDHPFIGVKTLIQVRQSKQLKTVSAHAEAPPQPDGVEMYNSGCRGKNCRVGGVRRVPQKW